MSINCHKITGFKSYLGILFICVLYMIGVKSCDSCDNINGEEIEEW